MQLAIETTMLTAPGSCSGAILCLLHRAAAGEAPALAGAAAAGARALALNVDIQLHAVKQCSPLEGKLRHRLLQQACLNHMLNLSPSVLRAGVSSALQSDARVTDLDLYSAAILKLACSLNGCKENS